MKQCKCGGPDPGGTVHKYCAECAELLAKVFSIYRKSSYYEHKTLSFSEFFRKMHS